MQREFQHGARLRSIYADEALHLGRGERDLVACDSAELLRAQGDEAVLDRIRLLLGARRKLLGERAKALAQLVRLQQPARRGLDPVGGLHAFPG